MDNNSLESVLEYFKSKNKKDKTEEESQELKEVVLNFKMGIIEKFKDKSCLKVFLDNICRFNKYSYFNQLLIFSQRPEVKYVSSFIDYKKMGYTVIHKDCGIKILTPIFTSFVKIKKEDGLYEEKPTFVLTDKEKEELQDKNNDDVIFSKRRLTGYKVGNVYDISDTTMDINEIENQLNPIIDDERAIDYIKIFESIINSNNYTLRIEDIRGEVKGYCDNVNKNIVVSSNLTNLMKLKTIIHEYAHSILHYEIDNKEYQENRNKYETEAETIAYVISNYLGFDVSDYSSTYLYSWSENKDISEIDKSLEIIVKNSSAIITKLKDKVLELSNNKNLENDIEMEVA